MYLIDILNRCDEQIKDYGDDALVVLYIKGQWGKKDYRTVLGVKGRIVNEISNRLICIFPAPRLKKAIEKQLKKENDKYESV